MTITSTGWLKTVGLNDFECQTCGWNVTAGEPRVYTYAGEGRPHRVVVDYKLDAKLEPIIELEEQIENVYHSFCYDMPSAKPQKEYNYEDYAYLTQRVTIDEFDNRTDGVRGESHRTNIEIGEKYE